MKYIYFFIFTFLLILANLVLFIVVYTPKYLFLGLKQWFNDVRLQISELWHDNPPNHYWDDFMKP